MFVVGTVSPVVKLHNRIQRVCVQLGVRLIGKGS